ncbi:NAD(P)-dependent oxidoreductase [Amnibacterium kyonggiense]|uniref:3-hydroxyisobutyrate dehydrogenase-like beta-hydroxyacid dehydrogenase n=1 Tax=Amnibacterium kyonggiense TaxID=595671 RepID=A0A4R7FJ48_9MICO|nr:NAD(P)-dependent oxidoreductase [Amnibacterium kyonggiense]TDS75636.1 3-hydroxyisobutyrate dehydrogenase-like beta-hydroxyacid dehydrogenase [Amnibacterium kyonggiense]
MSGRPTVAWLGLGRMGTVMVERLLDAGFEVGVWNRTPERAEPLLAKGATRIATLADALDHDLLYSMVLDDGALGRLHDPDDGLFSGAGGRATTWIDGSTVSVAAAGRAARAAAAAGLGYVSAPVSGNPGVVAAGRAIFAVSGPEQDVARAAPVLDALGRATHVVGAGAEANVVKLATNGLLAVVMQSLAELVVLGEKAGVPRDRLLAFINDSAVGSPFSTYKTAALVGLDFTPTFTTEGQRKDVRLALDLAAGLETPMPVLSTTEVAFSRTIASGLGAGKDLAAVLLTAARDAGLALEA